MTIEFLFTIIWAILTSALSVLLDWAVGQFIVLSRLAKGVERCLGDGQLTQDQKVEAVSREVEARKKREAAALAWGSDLVSVAIALDLATLGVWLSNRSLFPFFSRFNSGTVQYEFPIWTTILIAHAILLLVSLVLKHLHGRDIEEIDARSLAKLFRTGWFTQNKWMLGGNICGGLALWSSFLIMMDPF